MSASREAVRTTARVFFAAFAFSCFLFWWLPSIFYRLLGVQDPVHAWALWMSTLGLSMFAIGYFVSLAGLRAFFWPLVRLPNIGIAHSTLDACESLSYQGTVLIAIPAFVLAARFFIYRLGTTYGQGGGIPSAYQAVLYLHLFVGLLFLGLAKSVPANKKRILAVAVMVGMPRLLIALRWGRFFFVQAAAPIVVIALARGWILLSGKRVILFGVLAGFLIFVPALTRGDNLFGQDGFLNFFSSGSTLRLFQDNVHLRLSGGCPPLLVSLTAKTIPYNLLDVCTMQYLGSNGWPATLDKILTESDPSTEGTLNGTGSNYLLELYLTGGTVAIILGSALFGFSSRCFIEWTGGRSPFAGIWAECLSRVLLTPRGNLGYVYERIPSLALATLLALWIAWLAHARRAAPEHAERSHAWPR